MSSPPTGTPNGNFQDRLNRVAKARAPIEANKVVVPVIPDWKENFKYPAAIVGAAIVGMLAVLISRYVRFQLLGGSLAGEDADITMMIDFAIAGACSFALFGMMRFSGPEFKAAQTVGIAIMVMGMHNLVHAVPSVFNLTFSPQWTEDVVAYTEPNSILFRGNSFVLIEPTSEVAGSSSAAPAIRRAGKL